MDETLIALVKSGSGKKQLELNIDAGTVALVDSGGNSGEAHPVKPLSQLYGEGTGLKSIEFNDKAVLPLLLVIEEAICDSYKARPSLTDGAVLAALDRLCMNPETDVKNDWLAASIQFAVRVALSFNNYSRQDVRYCLRKVKQSANRHNKLAGTRGYLNFIMAALVQQQR